MEYDREGVSMFLLETKTNPYNFPQNRPQFFIPIFLCLIPLIVKSIIWKFIDLCKYLELKGKCFKENSLLRNYQEDGLAGWLLINCLSRYSCVGVVSPVSPVSLGRARPRCELSMMKYWLGDTTGC